MACNDLQHVYVCIYLLALPMSVPSCHMTSSWKPLSQMTLDLFFICITFMYDINTNPMAVL